jgi:hypothetical protein
VNVGGWAHLERHAAVPHERGEATQLHRAVVPDPDVVDDPDAVTESLGTAELERLPDRREAERFAGVDGDVEVLAADDVERVEVAGGPVPGLGPRDVEAHHARVTPADGALGDLDRAGSLAHRRDDGLHDDGPAGGGRALGADREPLEVRLDHLVEGQAPLHGQLRRVADLGVDDAVGRQVLGALGGDADDRVLLLEHADGVGERLEVELQALAIGAPSDPRRELVGIGRRQAVVAELRGKVDDRRRAEAAVEVVVEQRLRRLADRREREQAGTSELRLPGW